MSQSLPINPNDRGPQVFTASPGQTVFTATFPLQLPGDELIEISQDELIWTALSPGADYDVTVFGQGSAFEITRTVPSTGGEKIRITGEAPISDTTDFSPANTIKRDGLNSKFDRIAIWLQEARRDLSKVFIPISDLLSYRDAAMAYSIAASGSAATAVAARDIAVAAAGANLINIQSRSVAQGLTAAAVIGFIITAGYAAAGDTGGGTYVRVASEPSHAAKFRSVDRFLPNGAVDLSNGGWWALKETRPRPEQFGCVGDGSTDDATSYLAFLNYLQTSGLKGVQAAASNYTLLTWPGLTQTGTIRLEGNGATVRGPVASTSYFLRPSGVHDISGVNFVRWEGVLRRDLAEGGSITGARFTDNTCTSITGIAVNIEIPFRDSSISRNRFDTCSGGYVIRIGENTYANQDTWTGNFINGNVLRAITASGSTSLFAILVYGRDAIIDGNDLDGLTSTLGEAVGIYVKLRFGQVINNRIRNVTSSGGSGAALDVAGISLKGAIRTVTNSGAQGFKLICTGNQIRTIGAQYVKGTGIRCQISDSTVANNIIQDAGFAGITADDSNGSSRNKITGNSIEGFNILPMYGIMVTTFGSGHRVLNNTLKDCLSGIVIGAPSSSLLNTLIAGNSIDTTIASSNAFRFIGAGALTGVMITANDVTLPATGNIVVNDIVVTRVNIRNNDFAAAIAAGANQLSGSGTNITFTANP